MALGFVSSLHLLKASLPYSIARYSRFILHFPISGLEVSHFSQDLWFLSLCVFHVDKHLSGHMTVFFFPFQIFMLLIYFSCFNRDVHDRVELKSSRGHLCLIVHFRGNTTLLSLFRMIFAVGLYGFYQVKQVPSCSYMLKKRFF